MEFICIIIALALVYASQIDKVLHRDAWFYRWHGAVARLPLPPKAVLLLAVSVPVIAILLLHGQIASRFYGLAELALMLLVLLYCMGRAEYSDAYAQYRRSLRCGDVQGAYRAIDLVQRDGVSNFEEMHRSAEQRMLHERFDYSFAPIFWFFIAGPAGALMYRLVWLARDSSLSEGKIEAAGDDGEATDDENAGEAKNLEVLTPVMREEVGALATPGKLAFGRRWLGWLEWLPARLLGFAFALVGDFNRTVASITDNFISSAPTRINIRRWALAALGISGAAADAADKSDASTADAAPDTDELNQSLQCMQDLAGLMRRSLIVWVVAFAIGQLLV